MDIAISCYFNNLKDPQRDKYWHDNSEHSRPWVESIYENDMYGVILHDGVGDGVDLDLIGNELNEKNRVIAKKVDTDNHPPAIERFYAIRKFLCNLDWFRKVDRVFLTDLFDLYFNRNPFELMKDRYSKYYVGGQEMTIGEDEWLMARFDELGRWIPSVSAREIKDKTSLQAGVIGADLDDMLLLLDQLVMNYFEVIPSKNNEMLGTIDMAVVNYVMWTEFANDIFVGYPLNSETRANQTEGDFYIKHK